MSKRSSDAQDFSVNNGGNFPKLRELEDLSVHPEILKQLKDGNVMRVGVARVGDKVLEVIFDLTDAGELDISSEGSIFSFNNYVPTNEAPADTNLPAHRAPRDSWGECRADHDSAFPHSGFSRAKRIFLD